MRTVKTDWPRDVQPETYMHRLWRKWSRRAAIALGLFVALNASVVGGSLVTSMLTAPVLPSLPKAPAPVVAGIALPEHSPLGGLFRTEAALERPEAPKTEAPRTDAPKTSAPAPVADSGEYLVAVGMFASRERADELVSALTQAGLPAMQRPVQLRRQQVQQIVLGPFFSRSEAAADLRRLQALGGYADATVIAGNQ